MEREPLLSGDHGGFDDDSNANRGGRQPYRDPDDGDGDGDVDANAYNSTNVTGEDYAANEPKQMVEHASGATKGIASSHLSSSNSKQRQRQQRRRAGRNKVAPSKGNEGGEVGGHGGRSDEDEDEDEDEDDEDMCLGDTTRAPLLPRRLASPPSPQPRDTRHDADSSEDEQMEGAAADTSPGSESRNDQQSQQSQQSQQQQPEGSQQQQRSEDRASPPPAYPASANAAGGGYESSEVPEAPPKYEEAMWYNTRPVGADIPLLLQAAGVQDSGTTAATTAIPDNNTSSSSTPAARGRRHLRSTEASRAMMTPRTVVLQRNSRGFGIGIAGANPVHITHVAAGSPAAHQGVEVGERVLEVNSIDVKAAPLSTVEAMVQGASTLILTLGPAPPQTEHVQQEQPDADWRAALQALNPDGQDPLLANADGSTPPPSGLPFAMCSVLCCPLVGAVAVWHATRVSPLWHRNEHRTAYMHAVKARKFASSAIFYGILLLLIYIFASSDPDAS